MPERRMIVDHLVFEIEHKVGAAPEMPVSFSP
jgi:hypothetical protein